MTNYSDKLVQKTKDALNSINEASVLYTLVSLNKAVQDSHRVSDFPTIKLYRDWLVHTDLEYNKQLEFFFKSWDKIIEDIMMGSDVRSATNSSQNVLAFDLLFGEMASLGITLGLSKRKPFVTALVNSLLDAPLRLNGKHIKEFRFTYQTERKAESPSYICHMQIQHVSDKWFDGPELHF